MVSLVVDVSSPDVPIAFQSTFLAGVTVKVSNASTGSILGSGTTGSDGKVTILNLPSATTVKIEGSKPGFKTATTTLTLGTDTPPFFVTNFTGLELHALPTIIVSLKDLAKLQQGLNVPISGATVTISGPTSRTGVTDSNGIAAFVDIPTGSYVINVTHPNYKAGTLNTTLFGGINPIPMSLDPINMGNLNVKVIKIPELTPLSGATVSITGPESRTQTTDSTGATFFSKLTSGTYVITVSFPNLVTWKFNQVISPGETPVITAKLTSNTATIMAFAFSGLLPLDGVTFTISGTGISSPQTVTAGFLGAKWDVPAGTYSIQASKAGFINPPLQSITVAAGESRSLRFDFKVQSSPTSPVEPQQPAPTTPSGTAGQTPGTGGNVSGTGGTSGQNIVPPEGKEKEEVITAEEKPLPIIPLIVGAAGLGILALILTREGSAQEFIGPSGPMLEEVK